MADTTLALARIIAAATVCTVGVLVSGRLLYLLRHRTQLHTTLDIITLGSVALVTLVLAVALPTVILLDLAAEGPHTYHMGD